jgi:hypothetical protein
MCELSTLISDYMDFRAARGFQPNRKTEHLLTQFANTVAAERDDGLLFSQGEALAWAHAPVAGHPAWLSARLSTVRGFAVYLAGSGLPVGVPAVRQGASGSRRATPYLYSFNDIRALMTTAHQLFTPLRAANDDDADRAARGHGNAHRGNCAAHDRRRRSGPGSRPDRPREVRASTHGSA